MILRQRSAHRPTTQELFPRQCRHAGTDLSSWKNCQIMTLMMKHFKESLPLLLDLARGPSRLRPEREVHLRVWLESTSKASRWEASSTSKKVSLEFQMINVSGMLEIVPITRKPLGLDRFAKVSIAVRHSTKRGKPSRARHLHNRVPLLDRGLLPEAVLNAGERR